MKKVFRKLLWTLLSVAVVVGVVLELTPHAGSGSRLNDLPLTGLGFAGRDLPLNESEQTLFRRTSVIKRLYQVGADRFILFAIDSTGDRHAIHDPLYCFRGAGWAVSHETLTPLPGGFGKIVQLNRGSQSAEALYWITDGHLRHASALRAWRQSMAYRLHLARSGHAPMLVLLQPVAGQSVPWDKLIDRFPGLFAI